MIRGLKFAFALPAVLIFCSHLHAGNITLIDSEPAGKRTLELDPDQGKSYQELVVTATRKTAIFIHAEELLGPDMKTLLVVDDSDIRHSGKGLVLATFDGENVVHGRNGKVIMNYHHPDLCPTSSANRVYTVTGPPLTKQQLIAVLYTLKPEAFKLTDEEVAAQKAEIAKNMAETDRLAKLDPIVKKWEVLNGHGPVEKVNSGLITFSPRKGDAYPVTFDHTKDGGPTWTGVAALKNINNDPVVFVAYGTPKTVGLCVYEINGGKLSGKWYPWYIDGDVKNTGTEELDGPESLDGEFKITSAKAPATGAAYSGTVTIKPEEIEGAGDSEKPYLLTWTFGTTKVQGIGIRTGQYLFVSSGAGADVHIAKFKLENGGGTFQGDWFKLGSKEMGGTAAMN
jgi:hypothetical protein